MQIWYLPYLGRCKFVHYFALLCTAYHKEDSSLRKFSRIQTKNEEMWTVTSVQLAGIEVQLSRNVLA